MNQENPHPYRQVAINSFAVVGFVALLALGVWGGVYSARYVPGTVGTAAVYVGSFFTPAEPAAISVIPTASSTIISFGTDTSSAPEATTTPVTTPVVATPPPVTPKPKPAVTTMVNPTPVAPAPYGLSDLTVIVDRIGYLTTNSTDSFVASPTVPDGTRPAVRFTVKNIGTNYSGTWRFNASIPTRNNFTYTSDLQQSLGPGDSIDYVLGFDQATTGEHQPLTITVNHDGTAVESDTTNNTVIPTLTVLKS